MSEPSPAAVYAQSWLGRFGFALLAAWTLILGLAFFDSSHRPQLETVSETTAVGDPRHFQPPTGASVPAAAAMIEGLPIYVKDGKPFEVRDTHTRRVGNDTERGVGIYELSAAATDEERERVGKTRRAYLLKVALNQYVAAEPAGGKER